MRPRALILPIAAHDYTSAIARKAHRSKERLDIPDAGHFDLVTNGTQAWRIVLGRILGALGLSSPD